MSTILDRLLGRTKPAAEGRSWSIFKAARDNGSPASAAGEVVTESTALSIAAVYSCDRVLSESVASLPLHLYRRLPDGGREQVHDHPAARLLTVAPSDQMTAFEHRELGMHHYNLRGNAYSRIRRVGGKPSSLHPMHPDEIEVLSTASGIVYKHTLGGGDPDRIPARDVLHIKGLSPNGLKGFAPLEVARETFGHARAAQQYGARLFANDARPGGYLEHPGELSTEAQRRLTNDWNSKHSGENQHTLGVLEEGMKFQAVNITPNEAQFIETLKLKRSEIAGIFRVPAHMIGDLDKATFANIEKQDLFFAKHTLVPIVERHEQVYNLRLLTEAERAAGLYFKFNLAGIMRGDIKTRYEAYALLWDRGVINADQILALEDMNPQPDDLGSTYYVPMNFVPAGTPPAAPAPPTPAPEDNATHSPRREVRAALGAARQSIQSSYRVVLEDAVRRCVRRDVQSIRAAAKKQLRATGGTGFIEWLEQYFAETEYTQKQVRPVFESLASALGADVALELETEWEFNPALRAWVESYVATFAAYHAQGALVQLSQLVDRAEGDVLALLEGRLDEWESGTDDGAPRAERIAGHEATRFGGAFVRTAMIAAGVTYLVWRAGGDSCEFCQELNGRTVGVADPFIGEGEDFEGGSGGTLTPSKNIMHPPVHAGCQCVISAE